MAFAGGWRGEQGRRRTFTQGPQATAMPRKKKISKGSRALRSDRELHGIEDEGDIMAQLQENRSQTRVKGFNGISALCRGGYSDAFEYLDSLRVTISDATVRGVASSQVSERCAAAEALSLVFLTLGASDDDEFMPVRSALMHQIASFEEDEDEEEHGHLPMVLNALALYNLVEEHQASEIIECMQEVFMLFDERPVAAPIVCDAIAAYGVMATALPESDVSVEILQNNLQEISDIMHRTGDTSVRLQLGQLIALLVAIHRSFVREGRAEDDDEEEDYADCVDLAGMVDHRDLLATMEALARDQGRSLSKADRQAQRKTFKRVLSSLTEGEEPHESLEIEHQNQEVYGWDAVVRLGLLRLVLGSGLNDHLTNNDFVQELIGVDVDSEYVHQRLNRLEKRVFRGGNERKRKTNRGRERLEKSTDGFSTISFTSADDE